MASKSPSRRLFACNLIAAGVTAGPLFMNPAMAQDDRQDDPQAIEEVVVTAQRRETALEDTPLSAVVFSENQILKQGITEFRDYVYKIPGISHEDEGAIPVFGGKAFHLRGLSSDGTTSLYLDELPLGGNYQPRLHDVARIEVLRGPQGTLFGEGTMGGALRIITNQPVLDEFSGRLHMQAATISDGEGSYLGEAVVNIPIVEDKLAIRVSGYRETRGGWVDALPFEFKDAILNGSTPVQAELGARRDANGAEMAGGRVSVRWEPLDDVAVTFYSLLQTADMENDPGVALELADEGRYEQFRFFDYVVGQDFRAHNLTVEWDVGFADFLSSTSRSDQQFDEFGDVTFFIGSLAGVFGFPQPERGLIQYDIPRDRFSQELRLVSKGNDRWSWLLGAFYLDTEEVFNLGLFADPAPAPGAGVFLDDLLVGESKQTSFYGELGYRLTDTLELTLGGRFASLEQSAVEQNLGLLGDGAINRTSSESEEVLGKIWLTYNLSDDSMFYGGWSEGFRQGFGTLPIPVTCEDELESRIGVRQPGSQVDPDFVDNYEIGWKRHFGSRGSSVALAAYHIEWTDIITSIDLECGFDPSVNLGQAEVNGLEIEGQAVITDRLIAGLSAAFTDAEITDTIDPSQLGKSTPLVPEQHVNVFVQYSFPIMEGHDGYVHVDYQYMSERLLERPIEFLPPYRMLNARLGLLYEEWEFKLFVKNLTNEYVLTGEPLQIPGELRLSTATPRQVGFAVTRLF